MVCREYDAAVAAAGGFELAILGLGPNGHLGFNEPPIERDAPTRLVPLTPESIRSNARYWGDEDDVPREALTCGLASILAARQVLLVVSGPHKREILRRTLTAPPTADVPASWLQQAARRRRRARRPRRLPYSLIAPASTPRMKWRWRKR